MRDIYVALVSEDEDFNPAVHNRSDLEVRDVRLKKADEASYWSAELDVKNPGGGWFSPGRKTRAVISEFVEATGQVEHVLTGRIEGWPIGRAGDIVTLSVVAAAPTEQRQALEDAALADVNDDPWNLFTRVEPNQRRTPEERLGARHALLNYGRRDNVEPVLVDLIEGEGALNIGQGWIAETLRFIQPEQPITEVEVTLSAEWQQSLLAAIDATGLFPNGGFFGTLNSSDWGGLPQPGDKIGDWSVIGSIVFEDGDGGRGYWTPNYTVSQSAAPGLTAQPSDATRSVRFRRYFYQIQMHLAGVASARRKETLTFKVRWNGSKISGYEGRSEKIELSCSNLQGRYRPPRWQPGVAYGQGAEVEDGGLHWTCIAPHVSGSSIYADFGAWDPVLINMFDPVGGPGAGLFFGASAQLGWVTPNGNLQSVTRNPIPGKSAVDYAFGQAKAKILSSMRTIRASFDVPWEDVRGLTGTERIRIEDPEIPGGEMTGKLVSLSADLVRGVATLEIAAAPGRGTASGSIAQPQYLTPGIGNAGVVFAGFANDFEVQEQIIANASADVDPNRLISENATRVEIDMSPLPRGGNIELPLDAGSISVDCDKMIDLEAV